MDELDQIAHRVRDNQAAPTGPWALEVYPTLRCNLACAFCDTTDRHRPPQNELSADAWTQIIHEAADLGARHLMVLGGGEPLLAEATPALMRAAKERGLTGFLTTNGTRLARLAPMLADIGWDAIHVSIDGATAATHDALRGQAGSFGQAIRGLCRVRSLGRTRLGLHTVVTRRNVEELEDIVHLAQSLGCERVEFDRLIAYRPEQVALELTPRQQRTLPALVLRVMETAATLGVTTTAAGLVTGRSAPEPGLVCLKPWHHLTLTADGRASPCCVLAGEGERIRTVRETWTGDPFLKTVRSAMLAKSPLPRCAECSPNILAHERAIHARL